MSSRSKEDLDWRDVRNAATVEPDTRYTLHRVTNLIFAVCQFAAMICHIICFGVLLSKISELEEKTGHPADKEVCVLYIGLTKTQINGTTHELVEYNGGHSCEFVAFGSVMLAIMAAIMLIFLTVRIFLVNKMNFIGVFDVVEIIIAIVLTFAVSVTLSIGRSVTCSSYNKAYNSGCNDAAITPYLKTHPRVLLYSAMKSSETSSWVAFLFLLVIAVISILRTIIWFRKLRRERKFNVSAGLINNEVSPPSSDGVDEDKTAAAI